MISTQSGWSCAAVRGALSYILVLGLLAGGAGCRSKPTFGQAEVGKAADTVKLKPGLMISMSVLVAGKKELDEPAKRISEGGTIVLPLLGELEIADKNLEELQADLTKAYRQFFVDPQVILDFARDAGTEGSSPWGFVTVLGRVKTPGRVPVPATRDMTVSSAIQKAGGFAPSAKDSAILVTRSLANGQTESRTINLRAVGTAGRLEDDIVLDANDVVYVPEALF
ncbi:MAG: polysaccharide biosynthesis/export family protein [Kiritimatiellia bacterium]